MKIRSLVAATDFQSQKAVFEDFLFLPLMILFSPANCSLRTSFFLVCLPVTDVLFPEDTLILPEHYENVLGKSLSLCQFDPVILIVVRHL